MTPLCILLALGPALVWGVLVWKLASAHGRLGSLRDVDIEQPPQTGWPRLSVVVPARNEATDIEEALRSLLAQDYPDLEVIAVDDRSEDGTGVILDRLATEHASLRVLHIAELPDGWLGKTHACHAGARLATGSFLLFTDADVRFAPDALRRAIAFATSKRLGHLVAWPQLIAPGFWERCFQATFAMFLNFKLRPWELHVPGSRGFVGMGAFNLVSRDSYAKVGGHEILAMEVVDDVKLGLVLRRSGIRQGSIAAGDLVRVPWARGLSGSLRGLLKNAFAGLEWRWAAAIAAPLVLVALTLGPWLTSRRCRPTGRASYCVALPCSCVRARRSSAARKASSSAP